LLREGKKYQPKVHYFLQDRHLRKFSCLKISQSYKNSQSLQYIYFSSSILITFNFLV
jgi:hypothetical protein